MSTLEELADTRFDLLICRHKPIVNIIINKFSINVSIRPSKFIAFPHFQFMRYQDIDSITQKLNDRLSAAETHGIATGLLCGNLHTETGFWFGQIMQEVDDVEVDDKIVLEQFFVQIRSSLIDDEYTFELLLPDESFPLSEQAEALRQWCQGFLYGIGSVPTRSEWQSESREILKDITEFTKLDADIEGEEAENDFMEITEYLRAAVLYLVTELNSGQNDRVH